MMEPGLPVVRQSVESFTYHAEGLRCKRWPKGQNYDWSDGGTVINGVIVADSRGKTILPTHEASGLPLPVLPIAPPDKGSETWADFDHGFYPERSKPLRQVGGTAVRHSRGQVLPRWLHERKHKVFPEGPKLPENLAWRHIVAVLACADFVPRQAIDLRGMYDYRVIEMSDRQLEKLALSRAVHVEGIGTRQEKHVRSCIGRLFARYALEQDLSHISPEVIDEFLSTEDPDVKVRLGSVLLRDAMELSVKPVSAMREQLRDQGLMQLSAKDPLATVENFFVEDCFPDYFTTLDQRLRGEPGWELEPAA
jgi:hypothetical protein